MDFSKIDENFAREVIREAESYLDGQVSIASSGDQRAAAMASVFTAAGAALVAGVIAVLDKGGAPVIFAGIVASSLFLLGASLCIAALMPVGFWLPGAKPSDWEEEIASGAELKSSLGAQASNFQERIAYNNTVIKRNARLFKWGAIAGIAAPIVGAATWAVARCLVA